MLTSRPLSRDDVPLVWTIDRGEVIENVYRLENGALALRAERHDVDGWPAGEADLYTPILLDCFDRGGWCQGRFDGTRLVAAAILESRFIGPHRDQLQLKFLHVSQAYRRRGIGRDLFETARRVAREKGAKRLYISATPSENTINFYVRSGCRVTAQPDAELLALEPEDIHLECDVE